MLKAEQIPPEVVEAAAIDLFRSATAGPPAYSWATTHERTRAKWRKNARVTIAAALSAWPDRTSTVQPTCDEDTGEWGTRRALILPLPTEKRDAEG